MGQLNSVEVLKNKDTGRAFIAFKTSRSRFGPTVRGFFIQDEQEIEIITTRRDRFDTRPIAFIGTHGEMSSES